MDKVTNLSNYSIVLLSAGAGRRLGALGKKYPKCLLKINNKTLIELLINNLKKRKVRYISMIVGYKSKMLIKFLSKIKGIKINFIKINGYKKNGHSYSWFSYKDQWLKEKKPMILLHTDIYFNPIYLDNIIKSKKSNIIGIKCKKNHTFKKKSIVVEINKENKIKKIDYIDKISKPQGEIIGINKISQKTTKNIFYFMNKFFNSKKKSLSWEFFLNYYIKKTSESFYILRNQNYSWININTEQDYLEARVLKLN